MNVLIGSNFMEQHDKIMNEWDGNERNKGCIKLILDSSGYINVVNFEIYLNGNNENDV